MRTHSYFVYTITNVDRAVLYTGITHDLVRRLGEHREMPWDLKILLLENITAPSSPEFVTQAL